MPKLPACRNWTRSPRLSAQTSRPLALLLTIPANGAAIPCIPHIRWCARAAHLNPWNARRLAKYSGFGRNATPSANCSNPPAAAERRALADFIKGDPLLQRYFDVFLFEDLPATDRRADDLYLDEVDRCAVYVFLFASDYGFEDAQGVSPTEREFRRATQKRKFRLIFVKGTDDKARHPKMQALIRSASNQLVRRRFVGVTDLTAQLYASLVQHLEEQGLLRTVPFDAARCPRATVADLSKDKLRWGATPSSPNPCS